MSGENGHPRRPRARPSREQRLAAQSWATEAERRRWRYRRLLAGQLTGPLVAFVLTIVVGTSGYMLIEGWSFSDAFYMVAMTITTVGFGEVRPLSPMGRVLTIALIGAGVMLVWYTMSLLVSSIVESSVLQRWERRRMDHRIRRMDGHIIVCGYGRVGREAVSELRRDGKSVVVVESSSAILADVEHEGIPAVLGDATDDDTLHRAGIEHASGLVSTVSSDAANVFVTLSARALRPDLSIVARAVNDDAIPKLHRAGANQVVSPYSIGGRQMAQLAVRPSVVTFVDSLLRGVDDELLLEDIEVAADADVVGSLLSEVRRQHEAVVVLAVLRDGRSYLPPPPDLRLRVRDVIAVAGREQDLGSLEAACAAAPQTGGEDSPSQVAAASRPGGRPGSSGW